MLKSIKLEETEGFITANSIRVFDRSCQCQEIEVVASFFSGGNGSCRWASLLLYVPAPNKSLHQSSQVPFLNVFCKLLIHQIKVCQN